MTRLLAIPFAVAVLAGCHGHQAPAKARRCEPIGCGWGDIDRQERESAATSTTTTTTVVEPISEPGPPPSQPGEAAGGHVGSVSPDAQAPSNHEDSSPPLGGSTAGGTFACIRHFESDGNYDERSNPSYRGAYQIGYQEWADMGGAGDPADASPGEQDMRAERLQAARGWAPWTTRSLCGV